MYDQPRFDTQERQPFFADNRSMRPGVPGTVARQSDADLSVATGRAADGESWVMTVPGMVVRRNGGMGPFVARGQERYDIYCAPCHSRTGDGLGPISLRAANVLGQVALRPPTFHSDRLRHIPDGQMFATITNGVRNMPAYGSNIPSDDRWAIVTYVRALQLSQGKSK